MTIRKIRTGTALLISIIILAIVSAWAVSISSISGTNVQLAKNQHNVDSALSAAESGLEVGKYLVNGYSKTSTIKTAGDVTQGDRDNTWQKFCAYIRTPANTVSGATWNPPSGATSDLISSSINFGSNGEKFQVKYSYDANGITLESTGVVPTSDGSITKKASVGMSIERNGEVLKYAIASKARVWITGDSTIHGNIYSSWRFQNISPFNMTSDSKVLGTVNTILTNTNPTTERNGSDLYEYDPSTKKYYKMPYDLETLTSEKLSNGSYNPVGGKPVYNVTGTSVYDNRGNLVSQITGQSTPVLDSSGNRMYDNDGKLIYNMTSVTDATGQQLYDNTGKPISVVQAKKLINSGDEIQGPCDGIDYNINYGDKAADMPGMKISDYDTSGYKAKTAAPADDKTVYNYQKDSHGNYIKDSHGKYIPATVTEYAPSVAGNYSKPSGSGSLKLTRYVCTGKTLTNAMVVANKNALFENCTFDGILYVDGGTSTNPNNIRFDNCTFNGPIVTTPSTDTSSGWWQRNQLYFTGSSTFQNQTDVPATILAPNFSLDIGNDNPTMRDNNVLTGAIVGGIVDIRGTAQVSGTIISMYDTSGYSSGYVSNIGATLGDGGSETTVPGDVGVIDITPDPSKLLPSGITSPIIIKPLQNTYCERF